MGKYEVIHGTFGPKVMKAGDRFAVASFLLIGEEFDCPNAEREARALCRRLNAAAKKAKAKPKPKKKGKVKR